MTAGELNQFRAAEVAMVFQAAMNAFNPVITIGRQVEHIIDAHPAMSSQPRRRAGSISRNCCDMVRLPARAGLDVPTRASSPVG